MSGKVELVSFMGDVSMSIKGGPKAVPVLIYIFIS